ncbi:MAG: hypothetical protein NWE93_09305 [Candidatus Bathyarchaeota archaeon]|nr:hypothetical protein [Candidatus Bathyarchaeota archaeon]
MKIKQPQSNDPIVSLWHHLDEAEFAFRNCAANKHNATSIIYASSLLIMPNVVLAGVRLIDRLVDIANLYPNCICLVRTTTPEYFRGRMRLLQKTALDTLRNKCYVVVFSPYREFLNHAKFLLYYNFCLSEQVVQYGTFFGSTNFTCVGLGRNAAMRGNYEEFAESRDLVKKAYKTNSKDRDYLKEILYLINYKAWLYTDSKYLENHVSEHLKSIERLLAQEPVHYQYSETNRFRNYLLSTVSYNQTLALLDDIPGKRITEKIIEELTSVHPPEDPFEIEALSGNENLPDSLKGYGVVQNYEDLTKNNIKALTLASNLIRERYLPKIHEIKQYADEREKELINDLEKNHSNRATNLESIINPSKYT